MRDMRSVCDRCQELYPTGDLRTQTIDGARTGLLVCPKCFDEGDFKPRATPQDKFLKNPRPDVTVRYLAGGGERVPRVQLFTRYGKAF